MFFQYRTKAQRAEVTREERVFFPVERTGQPGGGRPATTHCHFPSSAVPSRTSAGRDTNTNNMYTHGTLASCTPDCTHCTCCTHAQLQKLACCLVPCLSLLYGILPLHRLEQIPRSLRSLNHLPDGTSVHYHPAAAQSSRASALRAHHFADSPLQHTCAPLADLLRADPTRIGSKYDHDTVITDLRFRR
jgi:hypothetical protein